jgi:hypothetical protein
LDLEDWVLAHALQNIDEVGGVWVDVAQPTRDDEALQNSCVLRADQFRAGGRGKA